MDTTAMQVRNKHLVLAVIVLQVTDESVCMSRQGTGWPGAPEFSNPAPPLQFSLLSENQVNLKKTLTAQLPKREFLKL